MPQSGKLIILSAPSGSGKTTLARHLLSVFPDLGFSVSATTRAKRGHEIEGRDYSFLSPGRFLELRQQQAFLEWEEVYPGTFYGTLKSSVDACLSHGRSILFDVDVQGAVSIKKAYGELALSVFVDAGGIDVLEQRLRNRKTESDDRILMRLAKARMELEMAPLFDYIQANRDLNEACAQLTEKVRSFLAQPITQT